MSSPAALTPFFVGGGYNYQISRSVRLRSSASAYLTRTIGTPTSAVTWTWSGWVKRGTLGVTQQLFGSFAASSTSFGGLQFAAGDGLTYTDYTTVVVGQLVTSAVYRDPSAWYHIVLVYDAGNATASNRIRLYVNGVQVTSFSSATYPGLNNTSFWNNSSFNPMNLGTLGYNNARVNFFDGYLAEVNFIDGQALTPSSFGYTDSNGIWQPKAYTGTYGTNGFYLKFTDNSAATAAAIGKDYSGNGNNWTPTNISVTAGTTYDSMIDSPTVGYAASNFAVLNPLSAVSSATVSNGNLLGTVTSSSASGIFASIACNGKNYCETKGNAFGTAVIGISCFTTITGSSGAQYYSDGRLYVNGSLQGTYATFSSGDTIAMDVDTSTRQIRFYKNNVQIGSTGTASGTDPLFFAVAGSGAGTGSASTFFNFGQSAFTYTPPTGFAALNTYNLPAATINNGATVMAASTYTGNGTSQSVSNGSNNPAGKTFYTDFLWQKARSSATDNIVYDTNRGSNYLVTNSTAADVSSGIIALTSTGFNAGSGTAVNVNGVTYAAWMWNAGSGTTSSNTNGSITSTVSVNQSAGFSIVTYTGTGSAATVGHGLGVAPKFIITKSRSAVQSWYVYHSSYGATKTTYLNLTDAAFTDSRVWNNTEPTSSVFSIGTIGPGAAVTEVAYCWSEVAGYSKFGSYTGNGSADGPFIYCGFRPRWIMVKYYGGTSVPDGPWVILDTSRDVYNVAGNQLYANASYVEGSAATVDILSNGFKFRGIYQSYNNSGTNYVFAAFAENPFNISRAR